MRVRRVTLSAVASLAVPHKSILSYKRHDNRINVSEHKICVLIFSTTLSETFLILILRRAERDIVVFVVRSSCKVPVIDRFQ